MYDPLADKRPYGATSVGTPTAIKFPLDTEMGVKRVFMVIRQVFGEDTSYSERMEFKYAGREKNEDIFTLEFVPKMWGVFLYRFEGELEGGALAFFGRGRDGRAIRGDWLPEWQLTVSKYAYKTPDWAKRGVTYQIFADRFCKVGERKFIKRGRLHAYWNERPDIEEFGKDYRADDFFGGNIEGIISRLDYLVSLGVSLIYLSPIFESSSNHRYDTGDYLKIDELFGDEQQFAALIAECKKRGIEVMLDGVFNHTGADSIYFNKFGNYPSLGAYQSKHSPYYDWYKFSAYPNLYDCWWGSTVVPTVNKSAEGFRQLLMGEGGVLDKWTKMGVKGWRLDVVDELPIQFTSELCRRIKQLDDEALIVGEVWEDASVKIAYDLWRPYFMGGQLDGVMNYPFRRAILNFATGGDVWAFRDSVTHILENYPKQSLDVCMDIIGSHDTVRALTALSGAKAPASKRERADFALSAQAYEAAKRRLMFAAALQYTLPGVPCLFYGDEAGMQGFEDPLNRGTYPWGNEDEELVKRYKALGGMRKRYADALTGETRFVDDGEMVVFRRESANGALTVYANAGDKTLVRKAQGVDALTGRRISSRVTVPPIGVRVIADNANDK